MEYAELKQRSNDAFYKVTQVQDRVVREDLYIMYTVLVRLLNELNKESVNCRRLKHTTLTYKEREKKVLQQLENLEKNLTFAALL
jgi:hypothetical protein